MSFHDDSSGWAAKYPLTTNHPLSGSIAFLVDRAARAGTAIATKHYAQRLMSASLDRRLTISNLEAALARAAVERGVPVIELG